MPSSATCGTHLRQQPRTADDCSATIAQRPTLRHRPRTANDRSATIAQRRTCGTDRAPPMIVPPPSRNDPCPCGSGLRYKHCHGAPAGGQANAQTDSRRATEASAVRSRSIATALNEAQAALASGNRAAAQAICRAVLAREPDAAAVWNLLGEALRASAPAEAEAAWRR